MEKAKALATQKDLKITVQQAAINKAKKQAAANKPAATKAAPVNKAAPVKKAAPSKPSTKARSAAPASEAPSAEDTVNQKAAETGLDPSLVKRFNSLQ